MNVYKFWDSCLSFASVFGVVHIFMIVVLKKCKIKKTVEIYIFFSYLHIELKQQEIREEDKVVIIS